MTVSSQFRANDDLFDQAAGWFFRLQADDVSPAERDAFEGWCQQSAQHKAAWDEARALYAALKEPARILYEQDVKGRVPRSKWAPNRRSWAFGLCCGALVMVAALVRGPGMIDRLQADYATELGQRQTVRLEDGSHVSLNTDTAITVSLGGNERVITVLRGEAYFDVAADKAHPFRVVTDQGTVTAVGTAFAVRQKGDSTALVVTEGVVAVQGQQAGGGIISVSQGQGLHFSADKIDPPQTIATGAVLAWREGRAVFRQRPLQQVIAELDRYWPGITVVADQDLAAELVSGVLDLDRRETSLHALAVLLGAEVTEVTPYFAVFHRD